MGTVQRWKVSIDDDDKGGKTPMERVITWDRRNPSYKSKGKKKPHVKEREETYVEERKDTYM
jgi:hypothetical protein